MPSDPADSDEVLEAELAVLERLADEALEIWRDRLPAAELALLRETVVDVLATHPNGQALVTRLIAPPPVDEGGGGTGGLGS